MAQIKVRNKTTGEVKTIDSSELPQYGLSSQAVEPAVAKKPTPLETLGKITGVGYAPRAIAATPSLFSRTKKFVTEEYPRYLREGPAVSRTEQIKKAAGVAAPVAGELGAWVLPYEKLGLIGGGAVAGGLLGLTEPGELRREERIEKGAKGAAAGAAMGVAMKGGGALIKRLAGASKRFIDQLFKPRAADVQRLRKFHGLDFADEVIRRDLPSIQGKSGDEILTYYNNKVDSLENAADDFLAQKKAVSTVMGIVDREKKTLTVKPTGFKKKALQIIDDVIDSRQGRVLQQTGEVEKLKGQINALPVGDLVELNQVKRDIQTAAKSYYTTTGAPSPRSDALAEVARRIRQLIEKKAPGIKEVNNSIAFYNLAQQTFERRLNQMSKQEMSWLTQMIGGGGIGAAMITRQPEWALAGLLPGVGREISRAPQFKTKAAMAALRAGEAKMPEFLKRLILISAGKAGGKL